MSLAMYAAPFDDNSNTSEKNEYNYLNKKRIAHNKTQKKYPKENFENFDSDKVNSILEKIHNNSSIDDDGSNNLGEFNPPPMPNSAGVDKTIATEQIHAATKQNNDFMLKTLGTAPQPNYEGGNNLDLNDYNNYGNSKKTEEYYKKILPGYSSSQIKNAYNASHYNTPYYNNSYNNKDNTENDALLQKLNYMIHLLEEKQDERTSNVTEEVVLYSFLGIFIIFVIDSFSRVGKYIR
jgi:hypothetical protein